MRRCVKFFYETNRGLNACSDLCDGAIAIDDRLVAITGIYRGHRRMTLTRPAIDGAGLILWIVSGSDKAEMIDRLVAGDTSIPAGVISQERAVLVTDVT